jgi:uncharacterized protein (TIGR03067 family)
MRTGITCLLFLALPALLPVRAADDQPKKDATAALQGGWKFTTLEMDGKPVELGEFSYWWVIKGDKVFYGGKELAKLTADTTTTPKCLDLAFRNPDRVYEAVYSIEDDTLKICINRQTEGVKERPNSFSTEGKSEWRVLVFKRDKERKQDDLEGLGGFVGMQLRIPKESKAILIADVLEDSPAKKAGLMKDDVLLKIGDQEITTLRETVNLCRLAKPGSELTLRIKRGDKEKDVTVKVGVAPFFLLDN